MNASLRARLLLGAAAVLLGLTLWLPLWRIWLTAPQYPEGLGMQIWSHTVTGVGPNDLQNINGLNHYIGMKAIIPESIPELRVMPWGIGAMAIAGLLLAGLGRRRLMIAWSVVLVAAALVGMADFWRWEYDYGHDLDIENAPIIIPGMAYQPPLIGTKQLLNFTTTSLPDTGGWLAIVAVVLGVASAFSVRGAPRRQGAVLGVAAMAMGIAGCQEKPRAILPGVDACAFCRMTVDDVRFAGQLVTARGKLETFDSIECLASFVMALPAESPAREILVGDAANPGVWLPAATARFVRDGSLKSPMGRSLAAFDSTSTPEELRAAYGGEVITWADVLKAMQKTLAHEGVVAVPLSESVVVDPRGPVRTISEGLSRVSHGGTVRVRAGVYQEPTIEVRQPVTLLADSGAVVDGQEQRELLVINADSVTIRGFLFRNTGTSQVNDRAAVHVIESAACVIEQNRFENTLFGIYLQKAQGCRVLDNVLTGRAGSQTVTGNGIHLWSSRENVIARNVIRGHRDAIYFEFVRESVVRDNVSEGSRRYGLHFMFSDSCRYENNTFRANQSGVAVMYSHFVSIAGNRFIENRGPSTYGLLLKEITDSDVRGNTFADNSIALHLEGASRNVVADNDFVRNGWAMRVLADAIDNRITGNQFADNLFDLGTNSRTTQSEIAGNWWDRYRGYDLNRNGIGDVPHSPVRLFALLVAQSPSALLLVRSAMVDMLDIVERVVPALTPATLVDHAPLMRSPRRLH